MRYLVLGLPKSATTALWVRMRDSLPGYPAVMERLWQVKEPREQPDLVAKLLIDRHTTPEVVRTFDRIVFLVRDPRDRLVSETLYQPFNDLWCDEPRLRRFIELLRRKETECASVSLLDLRQILGDWGGSEEHMAVSMRRGIANMPLFLLRYEDFVDGRLTGLEDYLRVRLVRSDVTGPLSRVTRTKRYGGWRSWFTPRDVEHFRPRVEPFMRCFGFDADDWRLECGPIDPQFASEYVLRIVNQRREQERRDGGGPR